MSHEYDYSRFEPSYPAAAGLGGSLVGGGLSALVPGLGLIAGPIAAGATGASMSPPGDKLRNALTLGGANLLGNVGGTLGGGAIGAGLGYGDRKSVV